MAPIETLYVLSIIAGMLMQGKTMQELLVASSSFNETSSISAIMPVGSSLVERSCEKTFYHHSYGYDLKKDFLQSYPTNLL